MSSVSLLYHHAITLGIQYLNLSAFIRHLFQEYVDIEYIRLL